MFGLHGRDTFNRPTSSLSQITSSVCKWWIKLFPYVLTILILVIGGVIVYVWHTYLYNIDVSDAQKQEHIDKLFHFMLQKAMKFQLLYFE